ncbi:hypothetical protein FGIG_11436 [Fasciola gigantica]|uniref:Uncharacterized protein n=1 Tax=Fasciola gigantica TaxID=46835 RepID=A0A504Y4I0_FASGI|nr:hypothetical protein FGIG_11436 [Fasciola gigantica]
MGASANPGSTTALPRVREWRRPHPKIAEESPYWGQWGKRKQEGEKDIRRTPRAGTTESHPNPTRPKEEAQRPAGECQQTALDDLRLQNDSAKYDGGQLGLSVPELRVDLAELAEDLCYPQFREISSRWVRIRASSSVGRSLIFIALDVRHWQLTCPDASIVHGLKSNVPWKPHEN